jgi:hypothetical protein
MRRKSDCLLAAGLLVLTVAAYLPVWHNDLVDYDDEIYITTNAQVREGLSWSGFRWAWTNEMAPYWHPLTWLSLQLDAHCFSVRTAGGAVELCPAAFHGQNLAWHAASAVLLFALWRRLTGARWRSFLAAALFALHPMHVESVAWAIERKDVLSGFFGILTLWTYASWVETPDRKRYLGMTAAFLLGLLAKPVLITLPFALLLLDFWPLRRWGTATPRVLPRRLVREKVPLFALAAAFAVVTVVAREHHGALVSLYTLPMSARLANALASYGSYLSATFCPRGLAVLYPHPQGNWSLPPVLAGAAALLSLSALAARQARRRPWLVVGWLWFVGTLVPVIGLAQGGTQAWADRFSYWPHIGLFVAVAWGLGEIADRLRVPAPVGGAAGTLVLGSLAALTWVQLGHWRNTTTLWERAVAVTRGNHWAHQHLSMSYRKQGRLEEADFHLDTAWRIQREIRRKHQPVTPPRAAS